MLSVLTELDSHTVYSSPGHITIRREDLDDGLVRYKLGDVNIDGAFEYRHSDTFALTVTDEETGDEVEFEELEVEELEIEDGDDVVTYTTSPMDPVDFIEEKLVSEPSYTPLDVDQ